MKKEAVLTQIRAERVIGLVHAIPAENLIECARALSAGGLNCLELAMTTPAAIQALEQASAELPDFRFGLGTVLDVETARLGLLAGASFIVTPAPRPDVITLCRRFNAPVISGAFTPADIAAAQQAGADAVKVFPGELFGPAYLRSLQSEFPHVAMIPIGGVTTATVGEFLRAGAMAVVAGSSLLHQPWVDERRWLAVTERASAFRSAIKAARATAGGVA